MVQSRDLSDALSRLALTQQDMESTVRNQLRVAHVLTVSDDQRTCTVQYMEPAEHAGPAVQDSVWIMRPSHSAYKVVRDSITPSVLDLDGRVLRVGQVVIVARVLNANYVIAALPWIPEAQPIPTPAADTLIDGVLRNSPLVPADSINMDVDLRGTDTALMRDSTGHLSVYLQIDQAKPTPFGALSTLTIHASKQTAEYRVMVNSVYRQVGDTLYKMAGRVELLTPYLRYVSVGRDPTVDQALLRLNFALGALPADRPVAINDEFAMSSAWITWMRGIVQMYETGVTRLFPYWHGTSIATPLRAVNLHQRITGPAAGNPVAYPTLKSPLPDPVEPTRIRRAALARNGNVLATNVAAPIFSIRASSDAYPELYSDSEVGHGLTLPPDGALPPEIPRGARLEVFANSAGGADSWHSTAL